jgi:hypothetical protein
MAVEQLEIYGVTARSGLTLLNQQSNLTAVIQDLDTVVRVL